MSVAAVSRREWCGNEGDIDNLPLTFSLLFLLPNMCGLFMLCVGFTQFKSCGCSVPQLAEAVKSAAPFLLWAVKAAQKALVLPFITKWSSHRDDVIGIAAA